MRGNSRRRTVIRAFFMLAVFPAVFHGPLGTAQASEVSVPLQPIIDRTASGEVLTLDDGKSYSGPAVIDKPLTLVAKKGKIVNDSDQPALTVKSDNVTVEGLTIVQMYRNAAVPAVLVESSNNRLEALTVKSLGTGIQLRQADDNILKDNAIAGGKLTGQNPSTVLRGNGIDLYESSRNTITGNSVDLMQDGIYIEGGQSSVVSDNKTFRSRYGFHFMFTEELLFSGNQGTKNVTGAMVMGVTGAAIRDNRFEKQNSNVNSQGLLLYDVKQSEVDGNAVQGNRVGLFVQQSEGNLLSRNEITGNFIGLQMLDSSDNRLQANSFVSNVVPAQSVNSSGNHADGNYWDGAQVLDLDGDGSSDLPYEINPFFLRITGSVPAFQLLFHSPGMPVLEQLFHTDTKEWLKDKSPLLEPQQSGSSADQSADYKIAAVSGLLLAASLCSIFLCRGKTT